MEAGPAEGVADTVGAEGVAPCVENLAKGAAPYGIKSEVANPTPVLVGSDGTADAFSEPKRGAFDEIVSHQHLPPDQSRERQLDATIADASDSTQPLPQPGELTQGSAIECERGEQSQTPSPRRQLNSVITADEGGEVTSPRDTSGDQVATDRDRHVRYRRT
jgi:hypothetical protein